MQLHPDVELASRRTVGRPTTDALCDDFAINPRTKRHSSSTPRTVFSIDSSTSTNQPSQNNSNLSSASVRGLNTRDAFFCSPSWSHGLPAPAVDRTTASKCLDPGENAFVTSSSAHNYVIRLLNDSSGLGRWSLVGVGGEQAVEDGGQRQIQRQEEDEQLVALAPFLDIVES